MGRKSRITAEQRAQWDEERRALATRLEERRSIGAALERREQRRRERLRRLSFGLLGREPLTRQ